MQNKFCMLEYLYCYFLKIKIFLLVLAISFSFNIRTFGYPNIVTENSDSVEVYRLCDSARNDLTNFESSLKLLHSAIGIANKIKCEDCIAETEYNLGIVFYQNSLYDSSLYYFDRVLTNYSKINSVDRNIETIDYISYVHIRKYDYKESIKFGQMGLAYADSLGQNISKAKFYLRIGNSFTELGLYTKSIDALMSAIEIFEVENDSAYLSSTLMSLGSLYSDNKHYSTALEYFSRALDISIRLKYKIGVSICLNNIGIVYSEISEHEKALDYYQRSMEIDKSLGDEAGVAIGLNNIGDSYRYLFDTVLAISYYQKCIDIGRPNNYSVVSTALSNLGEVFLAQKQYSRALNYVLESLELAESAESNDEILNSLDILRKIYAKMDNYEAAYSYLVKYKLLYDTIFTVNKSKYLEEIKARYDDEKQKIEISKLKKKSSSESVYTDLLTTIIIVISSVIFVMLIIILLIRHSRLLVKNQKQYFEKLLERSEDFVFVTDKNAKIKYISPSYTRKMGREVASRIGGSTFDFIHPDDIEFVKQELKGILNDKQPRSLDVRIKTGFDEWIYVHAFAQNMFDDELINGIVVNFWDITQRKKDEELIHKNEFKFRQIFNAFPDIYFQADLNGVITEISPSVYKISGYTRDEALKLSPKKFNDFINDWDTISAKFETEVSLHDYDTKIVTKDGALIHCSLSAELIFTDDNSIPVAFQGVIHDISARIKNQDRLRKSEAQLKEANTSKEKLFSIIAHDLIGPIGTNKSIVDLIVSQVDELSNEEVTTLITSLKPSLDSTYSLIENLLSWARIQQDRLKPSFENMLLNKLVEDIVRIMNDQAQRKSVKLVISGDKAIQVAADRNQLEIVLRNLVSNAIKFSNRGGVVSISFDIIDGMTEVRITDSGVGMNQDQIDSIMKGAGETEVKRGTNNEKGTGFGLVIVNEFVKNNRGMLSVVSKEDEGTTFMFTLPLQK